jgi:hypothetical protein
METAVEEQTFAFVKADIMARRVILVSIVMDTVKSLDLYWQPISKIFTE